MLRLFQVCLSLIFCVSLMGFTINGVRSPVVHSITVKITGIRNTSGRIQLQVYRDQSTFAKEAPWKVYLIPKKDVKDHYLIYRISDLSPGTYGLALLDDENSNTKMDYGMVMPKEGFGFSDYYHTAWSKPKFDDFKFVLREDRHVKMRVRYV